VRVVTWSTSERYLGCYRHGQREGARESAHERVRERDAVCGMHEGSVVKTVLKEVRILEFDESVTLYFGRFGSCE